MNKVFLIISLSFAGIALTGQNYSRVDSIVKQYKGISSDPRKLALQINYDFESDTDKARAIYTWITTNVKYDYKKFTSKKKYINLRYKTQEQKTKKLKKLDNQKIRNTYKRKKGICTDYSILFQRLCNYAGLECEIISGSSKTKNKSIGKKPGKTDHSWNAVKIANNWQLVDVTWGAGNVDTKTKKFKFNFEDLYFCTPPEKFFLNHFPKDTTFLFTDKSKDDFTNLPLYSNEFIRGNISVFPNIGVINFKKGEDLSFKINSIQPTDSISYRFNKDKDVKNVLANLGDAGSFKIPSPDKSLNYLTIYLDGNSLVTYKLIKMK